MMKRVLITGGAKRIGAGVARFLVGRGCEVVVHYGQSRKEAEALQSELGDKLHLIQGDLLDRQVVRDLVPQIVKAFGPIDGLINNASVFFKDNGGTIADASYDAHMEVNLYAPLVLSKAFAAQCKGQGNIINMLDYAVLNLPQGFLSYGISKSALWSATQMLAVEYAPHIRVNAIGPGHSLPNARESEAGFHKARKATPLQNGADPEEIARITQFILETPSMTGQIIAADGGKHLIGAGFY